MRSAFQKAYQRYLGRFRKEKNSKRKTVWRKRYTDYLNKYRKSLEYFYQDTYKAYLSRYRKEKNAKRKGVWKKKYQEYQRRYIKVMRFSYQRLYRTYLQRYKKERNAKRKRMWQKRYKQYAALYKRSLRVLYQDNYKAYLHRYKRERNKKRKAVWLKKYRFYLKKYQALSGKTRRKVRGRSPSRYITKRELKGAMIRLVKVVMQNERDIRYMKRQVHRYLQDLSGIDQGEAMQKMLEAKHAIRQAYLKQRVALSVLQQLITLYKQAQEKEEGSRLMTAAKPVKQIQSKAS
ncbi:hypothetical protein [Algivirga pacifica]|uniref:Uncharacterized protein n=1 Tax=Algivirga pacifica TaxID=1162670 RepID=A0ABP9DN43_9BACT